MPDDLETRLGNVVTKLETLVASLDAKRIPLAVNTSGRPAPRNLSARRPLPEAAIPATASNILGAMKLQGYDRFPEYAEIHDALAYGVPEEALVNHFADVARKVGSAQKAGADGHGANLRIDETAYDGLIDGRGIGYTAWSATPADQIAYFGYTQADIDALSAQYPERRIDDYWTFVESNGERGWTPRKKDARGFYL